MSGETEKNISSWTVDSLKELYDQRFSEIDKRYEQRFDAQEKAVEAALKAAKEAVNKAETAIGERLKLLNEFRQQSADRDAEFIPRREVEQALEGQKIKDHAISEKIDSLQARMERNEGRSSMAYPAFEKLMQDTAVLTQARSEGSGEKSGRVSQQQMLMMIVSLVGSLILIGGVVIAIAFAIRR